MKRPTQKETRECSKAESRRIRDLAVKNIRRHNYQHEGQAEDDGGNDSEEYVQDDSNLITATTLTRTMRTRSTTAHRPVRTSTRIAGPIWTSTRITGRKNKKDLNQ